MIYSSMMEESIFVIENSEPRSLTALTAPSILKRPTVYKLLGMVSTGLHTHLLCRSNAISGFHTFHRYPSLCLPFATLWQHYLRTIPRSTHDIRNRILHEPVYVARL